MFIARKESHLAILVHQLHTQLRQIVFVGLIEQVHPGVYRPR